MIIRNEIELDKALELVRQGQWLDGETIQFVGFPRFEITLVGERFDGGVPTRIMPALLELQRTVDKAVAGLHGKARLGEDLRRQTEIVVRTTPGSTNFTADLVPVLNTLAEKMSGSQAIIVLLGAAAIAGLAWYYKVYWNGRIEIHRSESAERTHLGMSKEETRRVEIIANLAQSNDTLKQLMEDQGKVMEGFARAMHDDDQLYIHGTSIGDGVEARRLIKRPRSEPLEIRLDGEYLILSVDSGAVRDGVRVKARDKDGVELTVWIPKGTLPSDQIDALKNGEWDKKPIRMEINATQTGHKVSKATLVRAGLSSTQND